MTQEAIALRTTGGAYPGLQVVQDVNKALQTVATDFAGPGDPAALAGPYMTWADTGNMLLKRRNAAGTAWVVVGPLLTYGSPSLTFKAAPSAAADDVVVQSQAFGVGQTWQDVKTSRALGATYVNATGKAIDVTFSAYKSSGVADAVMRLSFGALPVIDIAGATQATPGYAATVYACVPPGYSYSAVTSSGLVLFSWQELR